jgi:hypothetical protein
MRSVASPQLGHATAPERGVPHFGHDERGAAAGTGAGAAAADARIVA